MNEEQEIRSATLVEQIARMTVHDDEDETIDETDSIEALNSLILAARKIMELNMKFKVEVQADNTGTWAGNMLVFDTREQAEAYGRDLHMRWTAVRKWRVVEIPTNSDDQNSNSNEVK